MPIEKRPWMTGLLVLAGVGFSLTAAADSPAAKGRKVFERHKSAVVTVQLVIKQQFSMGGQGSRESEEKTEVTGTMIAPTGLTVTALSGIDPSRIYRDMMAARGMDGADFKMESEVTSAKILLEDGTELDARVLLRDSDLDLAFVRPTAPPESPLPYVDLTDDAEPALLEDVVALNRLGKVARRVYAATFERVEAIVTKPRTFYIPGQSDAGNATVGCPAFNLAGSIVGIAVVRTAPTEGAGSIRESVLVILVPAADVLNAAGQVPPFDEAEAQ